jgi:hypothetical protein
MGKQWETRRAAGVGEGASDFLRIWDKECRLQRSQHIAAVSAHVDDDGFRAGSQAVPREIDWKGDEV